MTRKRAVIKREAVRMHFLMDSDRLNELEKEYLNQLFDNKMSDETLENSLLNLSMLLHKHYGQKVILLIDEYDVPLDKAFENEFYEEKVSLIHNMFGAALKTNPSLHFAVLTGCLRVSKESIFTGLNNFKVLTIADVRFDEYFGFTDQEVQKILTDYHIEDGYDIVKEWYNGYHFGEVDVYCPWDVINYCDLHRADANIEPQSYWANTSSNRIVKRFIDKATKKTQREIEQLIAGETIIKRIRMDLTYCELDKSIDNLWSVLFTTGYLTQRGMPKGNMYQLAIPNREVREIFVIQIQEWFKEISIKDIHKLHRLCDAFKDGDATGAQEGFNEFLMKTISVRDTAVRKARKEHFYHGILIGLLSSEEDWVVSSNAESGEGLSDIIVEIEEENIGIVIEVKYAENNALDAACEEAFAQMNDNQYATKLKLDGFSKIYEFGIACYKKHCKVVCRQGVV